MSRFSGMTRRLIVLFAVLGVVGVASAFGPGALPGPVGPASPVLPDGTGGGKMTGALTLPSNVAAGSASILLTMKDSLALDPAGQQVGFYNFSVAAGLNAHLSANSAYNPFPSLTLEGVTPSGSDSNTVPLVSLRGGRTSAADYSSIVPNAALTTRPVLGVYNYTTEVAEVSATGAWSNPSSNTCIPNVAGGSFCISDSTGLQVNSGAGTAGLQISGPNVMSWGIGGSYTNSVWSNAGMYSTGGISAQYFSEVATTPAALSADVNDYAGCGGYGMCRIDSGAAARNITGIAPAPTLNASYSQPGERQLVCAIGANTLTLVHESASSVAANRFKFKAATNITVAVDECVTLIYDYTTTRWRKLN